MSGPWDIDEEDIPPDRRVQRRTKKMRIVGTVLWAVVIGLVTVMAVADVNALSTAQTLIFGLMALVAAVLAIVVGWAFLKLLPDIGAGIGIRIGLGIGLLALLGTVFPWGLSWILESVSIFEGLPTDDEMAGETLRQLLEQFFG